ncbi:peptidase G2 autoproteolytic cleavage domain-containing protein [Phytobacter sp. AG2a]
MTVSSQQSYVEYNADGSTTTFTVPFYFLQGSDLGVTIRYSDNTTTDLTYGINFSASGAGNPAGGSVTLNAAYPAGNKVLILRAPPATQETQYAENGKFPAKSHEKALDKLTMLIQQWGYWWDNLALKRPNFYATYYDAKQNKISNLADPAAQQDAVNNRTMRDYVDRAVAGVVGGFGWFIQYGSGAIYRTFQNKMRDEVSALDFQMFADGVNSDTPGFAALEAAFTGRVVNLAGKTYKVDGLPTLNNYVNGYFLTNSLDTGLPVTLRAPTSPATISAATDTGQYEPKYQNPLTGDYQMSGRTTPDLAGLWCSQNSYAGGGFPRAVVMGSIYSYSVGNVSGCYSARQCRSTVPQSVNIGSEDCRVDKGFRGGNYSSITSHCEGETGVNVASRRGWNNGYHTANIASVDAYAGGGFGAEFYLTVSGGVITSIGIVSGKAGLAYNTQCTLVFADRMGQGTGAAATFTLNSDGSFASVTLTSGGSGYSSVVQLYVLGSGSYCGNIFTANGCVAYQELSFNIGANNCSAKAGRSGNIAANGSSTSGLYSVNIASNICTATADNAATLASGSSDATAASALVMSGTSSKASAVGAVTIGRRTENNVARSFAFGDGSTGGAATSNRKFHIFPSGALQISGALTQNQVFTDIAKMFENIEEVAIPVGSLVAWEGRKVRLAVPGDVAVSAHSRTYAMLLGDSTFTWSGRYLVDDFGEKVMGQIWDEEAGGWDPKANNGEGGYVGAYVIGQLENPDYDPTIEQIPRSERRNEWTPVALTGEVHVRVDQHVGVDDYIAPVSPGLGGVSETPTRMRCMEIRKPYDVTKGYAIALCLRD